METIIVFLVSFAACGAWLTRPSTRTYRCTGLQSTTSYKTHASVRNGGR